MVSDWMASELRNKIEDDKTHEPNWYEPEFYFHPVTGTSHLCVIGPDGTALAMTGSLNDG